jgi:hypothetical protein
MKAIETVYKGYRFRSRLEARWAVFFDALGIEWQYEPEGFELSNGTRYLPDFHLCQQGRYAPGLHTYGPWIEVKGSAPTEDEILKLETLCDDLCSYGFLVWGQPGEENWLWVHKDGCVMEGSASTSSYCGNDFAYVLCGRESEYLDFEDAALAARQARFEFGESGARV